MTDRWDQEPSFDPRSWVAPRVPDPAPTPAPATASRAIAAPDGQGRPLASRLTSLLAAVVIASAGFVTARLSRPETPAPTAQAAAAPVGVSAERRTLVIPSLDGLAAALVAIGVAPGDARAAADRVDLPGGEARLDLAFTPAAGGARLRELTVRRPDGTGMLLTAATPDSFAATPLTAHLTRRLRFVRGELDGESFYSSAVAAGISDVLVGEFANAFRYDFDMQRELAKGDVFEAGFEQQVTDEGDPVGLPVLVYASLSTNAKSRALYLYQPARAAAEWVDAGGHSSRRSLMRTPVEAARISSGFGMRGHPILGFVKMHKGTDFAAPIGTPIFAAGDATVEFAGPKGPNGNFVKLRHDNGWETLYLHMNRIWSGIAPGVRVAQGQQIGEVGTTGRSTGPHLHYEVHIAGTAVDPLSIETDPGRTLTGAALNTFRKLRDKVDAGRVATEAL